MISIDEMNTEISNGASLRYSWYEFDARNLVLKAGSFEPSQLNAAIGAKKIADPNVKKLQAKHIREVHAHGFKTVSEGMLDSVVGARWFALVTAQNNDTTVKFVVGGGRRYFGGVSQNKPAVTSYFTPDFYKNNTTPSDGTYRTYTFKNGAFAQSGCDIGIDYFVEHMGAKSESELSSGLDAQMEQCEVKDNTSLAKYTGQQWVYSPRYFLWHWHSFNF
jgi:hypothetical protein